jgi:hypothetical protein
MAAMSEGDPEGGVAPEEIGETGRSTESFGRLLKVGRRLGGPGGNDAGGRSVIVREHFCGYVRTCVGEPVSLV